MTKFLYGRPLRPCCAGVSYSMMGLAMSRHALPLLLLLASLLAPIYAVDVGGGQSPGAKATLAPDYMSESEMLQQIAESATENCFLETIEFDVDTCTYTTPVGSVEMVCVRMTHNVPMAWIEGTDRQGLMSLHTQDCEDQMKDNLNSGMAPIERTQVQRLGDLISASVSSQGHCINMTLIAGIVKQLVTGISLGNLCTPTFEVTHIPFGYAFASEGDHMNSTEFGNWRGVISYYWTTPWLTPFTAVARAIETPGLCPVDYYGIFCHGGGWGTAYPATGTNPAESRTLGFLDAMWDSLHPTYAPFFTYGPLHLRLGSILTTPAHDQRSYQYGMTAMYAQLARNGYTQPLYPFTSDECIDRSDMSNDFDMDNTGTIPSLGVKAVAENNNLGSIDENRITSAMLWPRFTCCNYCSGSNQTAANHMSVGDGFLPQLVQ